MTSGRPPDWRHTPEASRDPAARRDRGGALRGRAARRRTTAPCARARVELTAVCARTARPGQSASPSATTSRASSPTTVRSWTSPDVDVVDVCATTDVHHEVAIAAARAGKHVIVEKPLTGYFGEAQRPARRCSTRPCATRTRAGGRGDARASRSATRRTSCTRRRWPSCAALVDASDGATSWSCARRRATPARTRPTRDAGGRRAVARCCAWARIPSASCSTSSTTRGSAAAGPTHPGAASVIADVAQLTQSARRERATAASSARARRRTSRTGRWR